MVDLQIIVTNYRTPGLLRQFLHSVRKFYPELAGSVFVADIAPTEPIDVQAELGEVDYCRFVENTGYALACNRLATFSESRHIAFFNADTRFIDSNCIYSCLDLLDSSDDYGAVGPLQTKENGQITHAGIFGTNRSRVDRAWKELVSDEVRDIRDDATTISGSAYFTKRSVWDQMTQCKVYKSEFPNVLGGFFPTPLYFEETGYSYHMRNHGYKVVYNGLASMIHEHNKSPGDMHQKALWAKESRLIFSKFCHRHGIEH